MSNASDPHDSGKIAGRLIRRISRAAGVSEKSESIALPGAQIAESSTETVNVVGVDFDPEISSELNLTFRWDFPTVEKLAIHLAPISKKSG